MFNVVVKNKQFQNITAIADVALTIQPGEHIALIGPSGCGKTTMLNIIAGLDEEYQHARITNKKLGYIFQENRLLPWLTIQENILLVAPGQIEVCSALLKQLGLENVAHFYPEQLSGGMQKRVSIARAFINEPDLLLLDEPFVSLDEPTADGCRRELNDLVRLHQTTVLLVTHDIEEALTFADKIYFLSPKPATIIHTLNLREMHQRPTKQCLLKEYPQILAGYIT